VVTRASIIAGTTAFHSCRSERSRTLENIRAFYPEESEPLCRRIALRAFRHLVVSSVELLGFGREQPRSRPHIRIINKHLLTEALRQNQGVVLMSAHYGNVGILPFALDGICKSPAYIMRRPKRRVGLFVRQFRAYREKYLKPATNFRALDDSLRGIRTAARLLKQGNAVLEVGDLSWGTGSVSVRIRGMSYDMSRLPASLAIRSGAAIIPVISVRKLNGSYEVIMGAPIEKTAQRFHRESETAITQTFASILGDYLNQYPEQWCWTHRQHTHHP